MHSAALELHGSGNLYVAEDGPRTRIVRFPGDGAPHTLVEVLGHGQSEITGLAFDPSQHRLYFSSQRGSSGEPDHGVTYELYGDFAATGAYPAATLWEIE